MMDVHATWSEVAQLLGVLSAVQHHRSAWTEFQADLQTVITRVAAADASDLKIDVLEELGRAAEYAQHGNLVETRHSLRDVAQLLA